MDVGELLCFAVDVHFDADVTIFIREVFGDGLELLQLSNFKEEEAPPLGEHEVEVEIHLHVGGTLDFGCERLES